MQINRNYDHREFGRIGSVEFIAPDGEYRLDGTVLPTASVEHLLRFALQSLQDAYAGAKIADDATAAFEKKRDRLIAGTLGERSSDGVDEFTRVARQLVRAAMKRQVGAKSPKWAEFTGLSDDEQNAKLDANIAKRRDEIAADVNAEIARRREKARVYVAFDI